MTAKELRNKYNGAGIANAMRKGRRAERARAAASKANADFSEALEIQRLNGRNVVQRVWEDDVVARAVALVS